MIRPMLCPICNKPLTQVTGEAGRFAPFCSERCRQVDFFRWSDGKYKIVEEIDPTLLPERDLEDLAGSEE